MEWAYGAVSPVRPLPPASLRHVDSKYGSWKHSLTKKGQQSTPSKDSQDGPWSTPSRRSKVVSVHSTPSSPVRTLAPDPNSYRQTARRRRMSWTEFDNSNTSSYQHVPTDNYGRITNSNKRLEHPSSIRRMSWTESYGQSLEPSVHNDALLPAEKNRDRSSSSASDVSPVKGSHTQSHSTTGRNKGTHVEEEANAQAQNELSFGAQDATSRTIDPSFSASIGGRQMAVRAKEHASGEMDEQLSNRVEDIAYSLTKLSGKLDAIEDYIYQDGQQAEPLLTYGFNRPIGTVEEKGSITGTSMLSTWKSPITGGRIAGGTMHPVASGREQRSLGRRSAEKQVQSDELGEEKAVQCDTNERSQTEHSDKLDQLSALPGCSQRKTRERCTMTLLRGHTRHSSMHSEVSSRPTGRRRLQTQTTTYQWYQQTTKTILACCMKPGKPPKGAG
eukprot:gb/GECG01000740.1/.p1 GENE.gb/GECG01000740.1/~~gb/GECG01000740.1/.p1  ORF type:complete len:444 (+),score=49.78 gb/GECG01000740.1/:1-1332(+)